MSKNQSPRPKTVAYRPMTTNYAKYRKIGIRSSTIEILKNIQKNA